MKRSFLIAVALLVVSCSGSSCQREPASPPIGPEPTAVPSSTPAADAAPVDASGKDPCVAACTNLRARKCPDGAPTAAGVTCEAMCTDDRSRPETRLTAKYLKCLSVLTVCSAEGSCPR